MGLKNQLLKVTFKIYQVGECVPRLGIESGPSALKGWSLTTGPPGNSQMIQFELMA